MAVLKRVETCHLQAKTPKSPSKYSMVRYSDINRRILILSCIIAWYVRTWHSMVWYGIVHYKHTAIPNGHEGGDFVGLLGARRSHGQNSVTRGVCKCYEKAPYERATSLLGFVEGVSMAGPNF